ncbi:hypothetical protein R6Q59_027291 [Mikania micrantha]
MKWKIAWSTNRIHNWRLHSAIVTGGSGNRTSGLLDRDPLNVRLGDQKLWQYIKNHPIHPMFAWTPYDSIMERLHFICRSGEASWTCECFLILWEVANTLDNPIC